jgi:hypothetical protein
LTIKRTTLVADRDGDHVPDAADNCPSHKGPSAGGGCPDSDDDTVFDVDDSCPKVAGIGADGCPTAKGERVVAFVDGKRVDSLSVVTSHGGARFNLSAPISRGTHKLKLCWYDGGKLVASIRRTVG